MKPLAFSGVYYLTYQKAEEPGRFQGWDNFNWFGLGERRGVKKAFQRFVQQQWQIHQNEPGYQIEAYPLGVPNQRLVVDGLDVDSFWKTCDRKAEQLHQAARRASRCGKVFSAEIRDPWARLLKLQSDALDHAKLTFLKLGKKLDISERYPSREKMAE